MCSEHVVVMPPFFLPLINLPSSNQYTVLSMLVSEYIGGKLSYTNKNAFAMYYVRKMRLQRLPFRYTSR